MTADKSTPVAPILRFPEFQQSPAWPIKELGDVFCERQETGFSELRLLSVTDREGVVPQEETNRRNSSNSDKANYLRVAPGDIVYNTMRMLEGRSAHVGMEGIVSPAYTVCMPGTDTNSNFFSYYFKTNTLLKQFRRYSQGLVKDTLSLKYEVFSRLPVGFPLPDEQRKIADCLGSLDNLIAAEGSKLEALRRHKKGILQQLFPQEGEAVPRLRFPEFRNEGEWEEKKAGSLFANRINKGEKGLPIYSVTMHDGMVRRDSLDRNVKDIEEAGNKTVRKNDIAYNMMRMWQGALGVAPEDCLVSPAYIVLAPKKHVIPRFFEYLFKLPTSLMLSTSYSRGLTKDRLRLYYDDFARIPLRCPTEPEQQRIAECLCSLDACVAAQARRLDVLGVHKHGLLQQLFPSSEDNE
jgi:type I restriction enzyme S subunit